MHKTKSHDLGSLALNSFQALIDAAPDGGEQPSPETFPSKPNFVRTSNGWGEKYCQPIELKGAEWLETFSVAKGCIAEGGIVAFLGGRGPGKTRMAAEIARDGRWPEDRAHSTRGDGSPIIHRGKTALYRRAMGIFLELREATKAHVKSSEREILTKLSEVGLLVIDEFQDRGESEWENRIMNHLLDQRYSNDRPTIIIANMDRNAMGAALGDSIKSRIVECGTVLEFNWPSFRATKPQ